MVYLLSSFSGNGQVVAAVRALRAGGASPSEIDLFSEEPVELPRGLLDRPSRISLATVAGAIGFGALATAFIYWSQHAYQLATGGMPVFSMWATGVITYEMTMLGAIVTAFAAFLWTSGLIRRRDRRAPVPELAPGLVWLRLRCSEESVSRAATLLRNAGAGEVERRGEP